MAPKAAAAAATPFDAQHREARKSFDKWVAADRSRKMYRDALVELDIALMEKPSSILPALHHVRNSEYTMDDRRDDAIEEQLDQPWDFSKTNKVGKLNKSWWWQLVLGLPNTGLTTEKIILMEAKNKKIASQIREFAFGVTDNAPLTDKLMIKTLASQTFHKRYTDLGKRLEGFFTNVVADDGFVNWTLHGIYKLSTPDSAGRFSKVAHRSGAEAPLGECRTSGIIEQMPACTGNGILYEGRHVPCLSCARPKMALWPLGNLRRSGFGYITTFSDL